MNKETNKKENTPYRSLEYEILKARWKTPWWQFGVITSRIKRIKYEKKYNCYLGYLDLKKKDYGNKKLFQFQN